MDHKLTDVGTRYRHLTDLKEDWLTGIEIMGQYGFLTKEEESKRDILKSAIDMLTRTMDGLAGYADEEWQLRKQIDECRKGKN